MSERTRPARCPIAGCTATMNVPLSLPAGDYDCKCHAGRVRLAWATYLQGGRQPSLRALNDPTEEAADADDR